jgi:hypothetical protein
MPGQDLGLPGPHRASQPGQLRDPDAVCPAVEALQGGAGRRHANRGVDRAKQLLPLPGGRHLAIRIARGKTGPQPPSASAGELLGRGQQQLADAVQRVALASPMPQRGLLHATADLIDHRVGQPDGMEVVHHHGRMPKRADQRAGIPAPGVQRHHANLGQPSSRPSAKPAGHSGPGPVAYQVQQPAALQVHQAGDPPGGRQARRLAEAGLIQPKRGHILQPPRVIHQRPAVVSHRPHHRLPANPEVTGHRRHRVGVLADPPAGLGAGPLGQYHPRSDPSYPLSPGPHPTSRLPTAPDPLAPAQHHRPATNRQVTHPDHPATVRSGSHPAAHAADHRGRGLDIELPLATYELGCHDLQAIQVQQRPRRTTLLTHLGPSCRRQTSASSARSQVLSGLTPHRLEKAPHAS